MVEVILLALIDNLRSNENKVFMINNKKLRMPEDEEIRWWKRAHSWTAVAKKGLPLAYLLLMLAIVMPGFINTLVRAEK